MTARRSASPKPLRTAQWVAFSEHFDAEAQHALTELTQGPRGKISFCPDIYSRDVPLVEALQAARPLPFFEPTGD